MLLTRLPLGTHRIATAVTPLDLHVLGTPPAFTLSQDQTLQKNLDGFLLAQLLNKFNVAAPVKRLTGAVINDFENIQNHQ